MEELTDILVGLEQRIHAYKNRLHELEKNVVGSTAKSPPSRNPPELAETLHRVEADKSKLEALSTQVATDDKGACILPVDVTDHSREILLGRRKYAGKSVPESAYQVLREANRAMHAKELDQRLVEGGLHIKGKTSLASVATSLKRDKRFRKVGPTPSRRRRTPWAMR